MSNGETATHLIVGEMTVKTHVTRILMNLASVSARRHLARRPVAPEGRPQAVTPRDATPPGRFASTGNEFRMSA
jgi:hypothetical protein